MIIVLDDTYILEMTHIVKTFPGVRALGDGCLRLKKGEIHALVGENGAGKSTLMKILLGDFPADSGEIIYKGEKVAFSSHNHANRAGICMIPQEVSMIETMDAAENVWLHQERLFATAGFINKRERLQATQELFNRMYLNLDPNKLVAEYSSAQRQMLAIAKAVAQNSDVIIMDEPTSSLSDSEVKMLFDVMRDLQSTGVSIVFISHKIEEIVTICQTITVLRDGLFISEHATGDITREDLIAKIAGRKIEDMYPPKRKKFGEIIFEVKELSAHGVYSNISFSVREGEILGLYGLVGAGRSEVMRAVYGVDRFDGGEVRIQNKRVKIRHPKNSIKNGVSMVTEDRLMTGIISILSVKENMSLANLPSYCNKLKFVQETLEEREVVEMIERMNVKLSTPEQPIGSLSGGNQQKAILGKWLLTKPKVFILDEPTRGIDVGAKFEIYSLIANLAAEGMAVILISSELPEMIGMADRVITFCEGRITAEFLDKEIEQERIVHAAFGF